MNSQEIGFQETLNDLDGFIDEINQELSEGNPARLDVIKNHQKRPSQADSTLTTVVTRYADLFGS
jgi:hypothetical protein